MPRATGGERLGDKLRYTLALGGGNGYHRDAEGGAHFLHIAMEPPLARTSSIILRAQYHGDPQLQKLQSKVEITLDIGGIHNIDDAIRLLIQDEIPGDDLLLGIGPQRIDAWQIDDGAVPLAPDIAHFLIDGDAGKIADMPIGAGEGIEQGGFAAILIAGQCEDRISAASFTSIFWASSTRRVSS